MAAPALGTAPVLSTPDTHIFEDPTPPVDTSSLPRLSDEQITLTYEIKRTVSEIHHGQWKRIALQFPDHMLVDAPRVYRQLDSGLRDARKQQEGESVEKQQNDTRGVEDITKRLEGTSVGKDEEVEKKLFILADTSYGACCVDEVAAEHVDADVVVHYGRSCLSPASRLPVIYVFTERPLDIDSVVSTFKETYPGREQKVILVADIPYHHHISSIHTCLQNHGYTNVYATEIVHNPSSLLPNRTVPSNVADSKDALRDFQLFHISEPPASLLLTLSSRVSSIHIYPTDTPSASPKSTLATTAALLRRRYAILTSLTTTPVFGILINTLSVKNYMHILSHVQDMITSAGKKYYTFVVGKVNAAKVANFSEVGGWVVIGCWESSLIESKEFWRPIITPWELGLALKGDESRVWTGEWESDFQRVLDGERTRSTERQNGTENGENEEKDGEANGEQHTGGYDSEEESAPPEFDLRTGRYVSHSRPMRSTATTASASKDAPDSIGDGKANLSATALTRRPNGDIAHVAGIASPGAEFLRSNRTWQGLGSDFKEQEENEGMAGSKEAAKIEEGRSGIARGYIVRGGDEVEH